MQKKAQVTLFIIIAIVIVAAGLVFFLIKGVAPAAVPEKLQPVENYYSNCITEKAEETIALAGMQGGYLDMPAFEPGSQYKQFSNYYMFLGSSIPYWYYVSGNNLVKEQVPSKETIENQISDYMNEKVKECSLDSFVQQGYSIEISPISATSTTISDGSVSITVNKLIKIGYGDIKANIGSHKAIVKSNLGALYSEAVDIYNYEKNKAFIENYTIDTLYLNAPVTGVELSCAPKIWLKSQIQNTLKQAINANIGQVKIKGSYYSLASSENKYFVVDTGKTIKDNVNFLAGEPYRIEIWPSQNDNMMEADPVGIQPGLSLMGFCYVPYHFVYDIDYPVLVQVSREDEIFQFPMAIVIDKTVSRKAITGETGELESTVNVCNYKGAVGTVYTYNQDNEPVEADVSFKCFNQVCPISSTENKEGKYYFTGFFPQCLNGFVLAEAPGYAQAKVQVSTNVPFTTSVYLQQLKKLSVSMNLVQDESAIVTFASPEHSATLFYPTNKEIELSAGDYQVSAQVFKDNTISLQSGTTEKCIQTKDWLGFSHEQCYNMDIPSQTLTSVIFAGGSAEFAPTEQEIKSSSRLTITVPKNDVPSNLVELEQVYSIVAVSQLDIKIS